MQVLLCCTFMVYTFNPLVHGATDAFYSTSGCCMHSGITFIHLRIVQTVVTLAMYCCYCLCRSFHNNLLEAMYDQCNYC